MLYPGIYKKPTKWSRDPAVFYYEGYYQCFYTGVLEKDNNRRLTLELIRSQNLRDWSPAEILLDSSIGYSSPGNIIASEEGFILCFQSYPINKGELYGNMNCRLWYMKSKDLKHFTLPSIISSDGCTAHWARTKRQIDPYMIKHNQQYYVFYKTDGCIGLMCSPDMNIFREISLEKPVLSPYQTPDGSTIENPCIVPMNGFYKMFFAPCRKGRGIGTAESEDLIHWHNIHYLDFPSLPWAPGGPTAPMVLDDRERTGKWLMFFHGDTIGAHGGELGLAYSDNLEKWTFKEGSGMIVR
ncbi:MAG: hypothetical protein K0S61_1894 [Anaerocolumna sp.]|jgi:predicted GH43/DUF377 family glycosyl hydrolase|nr:hypothetical protein [Anaerocolumna sp.]